MTTSSTLAVINGALLFLQMLFIWKMEVHQFQPELSTKWAKNKSIIAPAICNFNEYFEEFNQLITCLIYFLGISGIVLIFTGSFVKRNWYGVLHSFFCLVIPMVVIAAHFYHLTPNFTLIYDTWPDEQKHVTNADKLRLSIYSCFAIGILISAIACFSLVYNVRRDENSNDEKSNDEDNASLKGLIPHVFE